MKQDQQAASTSEDASRRNRPIVITLHGIRTRGAWQKDLADELNKSGFLTKSLDYGRFSLLHMIWPPARRRKLDWFHAEYTAIKRESGRPPSVIAHSFGTYLVARLIESFPGDIKFERLVFCGSIVRRDYPWSALAESDLFTACLNDCGMRDIWSRLVEWTVPDAGASGVAGFSDTAKGKVVQQSRPFSHSAYFYWENFHQRWIPFLRGDSFALAPLIPAPRIFNWKFLLVGLSLAACVLITSWMFFTRPQYQISIAKWIGYAPYYIARSRGMSNWTFKDRANMSNEERDDHLNSQQDDLFVHTVDAAYNDLVTRALYKLRPLLLQPLAYSFGADAIVANKSIASISGLRGKRVGVWIGSSAHILLVHFLRDHQVPIDSVTLVQVSRPEAIVKLLRDNHLDAAALYSPYVEYAIKDGSHLIGSSADVSPPFIVDALYAHSTAIDKITSAALAEVFSAWDAGVMAIRNGEPSAMRLLGDEFQLSESELSKALSGVRFLTTSEAYYGNQDWTDLTQRVQTLCKKAGLLRSEVKGGMEMDLRFLQMFLDREGGKPR